MDSNLTLGILLTDHVVPKLLKKHGDQDEFYEFIFNKVDPRINLKVYDVVIDDYPNDIDECDGYIITGSKLSTYDDVDWIKSLEEYIRLLDVSKKNLLGVCFGHQLIAQALGGKVEKAKVGWTLGIQAYNFLSKFPWVKNHNESVRLIHSHQDQVTELPSNAELIAKNDTVPIAMFRIGDHIMSMQGHPEFSEEYAHDVANMRKEILGEKIFSKASQSLMQKDSDRLEVTQWWVDFFNKD